jgi:endonuclease/exonuclease/phosphatase family metal-dependent hydrolase
MMISVTKYITTCFFVMNIFILISHKTNAQQLRVATYNIRYDNPGDSGNLWKDRKSNVAALIRYHGFEIFGVQEALHHQLNDLSAALPGFAFYGRGRDDGKTAGEHSSVYWRTDLFELLDKGDFWLSETPDKPGPGWDATLHRICTWVKLKHKRSGKSFHIFNAHYDHRGVQARIGSSKLILQKIRSIAADGPVVFMGDLNGNRESDWYKTLSGSGWLADSHFLAGTVYAPNGSFNAFRTDAVGKDVIDHIFVSSHFKPQSWAVLTDTYFGKFPSDHFPVFAELALSR